MAHDARLHPKEVKIRIIPTISFPGKAHLLKHVHFSFHPYNFISINNFFGR
jgi:hypothetical protein